MKEMICLAAAIALIGPSAAMAEGDLSRANPTKVTLEMGTTDGHMYFKPSHLEFETGKAYNLVLKNVDQIKHEIGSHGLVERIFTRKVEIANASGDLVAEIKGNIREIEIGPGQEVQWFFVPIQPGEKLDLKCALEGHAEAGMVGDITIR
jgi:uncharacterized cupredoxin-like copper-binding protein